MELIHGDCLEEMKKLPNNSIDLFICDLPYGCLTTPRATCGPGWRKEVEVGLQKTLYREKKEACAWDVPINLEEFWIQVERLMKNDNTPIIHFCNTRFGYELIKSKEAWFRYDLIWSKPNGVGFLNANKQPMRNHENIYIFAKKGATYYRKDVEVEGAREWKQFGKPKTNAVYSVVRENEVIREAGQVTSKAGIRCIKSILEFINVKTKGRHPTQKPLDLYKFLIERYSKEGETVMDATAGSFTSGLACKQLNRKYIGIELNNDFYKKGVELLNI